MKYIISSFFILILFCHSGNAQTRTDSISATYTRSTSDGVGFANFDLGNGMSAEVPGYTISTTEETLVLDKYHCAALTVNTQPESYRSFYLLYYPVVYYGIWRMSGDTISITYSKSYSPATFVITINYDGSVSSPPISKLSELMIVKYLWEDGSLQPISKETTGYGDFYKEEKLIQ